MRKLVITVAQNGWIVREDGKRPVVFTDWKLFIKYQREFYERVERSIRFDEKQIDAIFDSMYANLANPSQVPP